MRIHTAKNIAHHAPHAKPNIRIYLYAKVTDFVMFSGRILVTKDTVSNVISNGVCIYYLTSYIEKLCVFYWQLGNMYLHYL